jgi:leucyl aminopeptidase (aminopeptidase T)
MLPEYGPGARNAVRACLNVHRGDRVIVIETRTRQDIAEAIVEEVLAVGADVSRVVMEDVVTRPAREFPRTLAENIRKYRPTASYYVGEGLPGELAFRHPMLKLLADELRCRHGHMMGIERRVMLQGMAADYEQIYRVTRKVYEVARQAEKIQVTTALGTELTATFRKDWKWIPCDGRYWEQGQWGNLPEGETFTTPFRVDGLLVGEEMGDHFDHKYGLFETPVRLRVRDSRVVGVEMDGQPEILAEIESYFAQHPESNRAGEFAIGTNIGLTQVIGNFLQDEKFPGVHVAFGDPYGRETGADWEAPSHVDVLASHADVVVDGRKIMENGRFLI